MQESSAVGFYGAGRTVAIVITVVVIVTVVVVAVCRKPVVERTLDIVVGYRILHVG